MTEYEGSTNDEGGANPAGDRSGGGNAWLKALGIFWAPSQSFEIIGRRRPWLAPLLLLVAGTAALATLSAPLGLQATRAQLTQQLSGNPEHVDALMAQVEQVAAARPWLPAAVAQLPMALGLAMETGFVWLLAIAFQGRLRFTQSLSLMFHLALIAHLRDWINFLLVHLRGTDAIRSQFDLQAPMGLDLLLAGDNPALNAVYASLNPFTAWFLALLALGAASVFEVRKSRAWTLAAIYWAATTGFTVATTGVAARLLPT